MAIDIASTQAVQDLPPSDVVREQPFCADPCIVDKCDCFGTRMGALQVVHEYVRRRSEADR